jgi:hypothetical protein
MAVNPFPFTQTRDLAATSPLERSTAGKRVVVSAAGAKRIAEQDDMDSRQHDEGAEHPKPRDERERDAQRQALSNLILGAFDELIDAPAASTSQHAALDGRDTSGHGAGPAEQHPDLEKEILEFLYALFQALDQIDDAEPTLDGVIRPFGAAGGGRSGRSAFGERLDLLARRIASGPVELLPKAQAGLEGLEGVAPRLARSYLAMCGLVQGGGRTERPGTSPRAQLAALLLRLANALHVAPTLGYGAASGAGAMLRVRA